MPIFDILSMPYHTSILTFLQSYCWAKDHYTHPQRLKKMKHFSKLHVSVGIFHPREMGFALEKWELNITSL